MSVTTLVAVKSVLVADDTAFVRDRFRSAIEGGGHLALTVQTGDAMIAALRRTDPNIDLVVMDMRLREGHGLALLQRLRREHPAVPILAFSGTLATSAEVRALKALGVAGFINEYIASRHILPSLAPHLFPDEFHRRSSPRVVVGIPVSYRIGPSLASALTLNISEGGLALRTTSPIGEGMTLRMRFRLPGTRQDVTAEGRIVWVDRRGGVGIQFTQIADGDRDAIRCFVEAHFFTNRKA